MTQEKSPEQALADFEAYLDSERCQRDIEYTRELLASKNSFDAYWAGSASASVMRDYRAGRVINV